MSINPAEEESESVNEIGRIARGIGMAGMQMKEATERKRDRIQRQTQAGEAEQQRQAEAAHRNGAEHAKTLHQEANSAQFWKTTSNAHLARSITDAQDLAAQGHGTANNAYMAYADRVRDLHGLNIENVAVGGTRDERFNALQAALDDHNSAGRLRDEAQLNDHAAESIREEQQAQAEDAPAYDEQLRSAAVEEAAEAGLDTDDYLDQLSAEDREAILNEPDNAEARDARIEGATHEDAGADADRTHSESHPEERHYDTAAETARDDADQAQASEKANTAQAAALPNSQHGRDMNRHLDDAAKRDPQSAAARRSAAANLPADGKDYVKNSIESKAHVRKAAGQQQRSGREHVQQR